MEIKEDYLSSRGPLAGVPERTCHIMSAYEGHGT